MTIPAMTKRTISNYVEAGYPPGGYITAMIAHDYDRARAIADHESRAAHNEIVEHIASEVPPEARGSYQAIRNWRGRR